MNKRMISLDEFIIESERIQFNEAHLMNFENIDSTSSDKVTGDCKLCNAKKVLVWEHKCKK